VHNLGDRNKVRCILGMICNPSKGGKVSLEPGRPAEPNVLSGEEFSPLRSFFAEAMRYWEPRRLIYNFALTAACVGWVVGTWPHFHAALTLSSLLPLSVLALIANACYCAAYLVDIPLQRSSIGSVWRRRRWALWLMGTLFAIVLASYWIADEIYPSIP
jgi:hypothetical protein